MVSLAMLLVLTASCVTIDRRQIVLTPGPVPAELQGARWQDLPVRYCFVSSELEFVAEGRFEELTNEAFARWGLDSKSNGHCDRVQERNGRNEITWGEAPELGGGAVYEAGYARVIYSRCVQSCPNGNEATIVEADIFIDPTPPERAQTEECLFTTLLHEVGHFLGVPHLESPAIMAPVSSSCPQDLTAADRQALADLYGAQAIRD
jgi:hypothetical protein